MRQDKGNCLAPKMISQHNKRKHKRKTKIQSKEARPSLSRTNLPSILQGDPFCSYPLDPRRAQKLEKRLRSPSIPQRPERRSVRTLPFARLFYILPMYLCLRGPRQAPGGKVVPGLGLATGAPPTLARVRHVKLHPVGPRRRATQKKQVIAAGEGLPHLSKLGPTEASSRRGYLPSTRPNMRRDPLCRLARPSLGGNFSNVREGYLSCGDQEGWCSTTAMARTIYKRVVTPTQ